MVFLIYGFDFEKRKKIKKKIVDDFFKKNQKGETVFINDLNFNSISFKNFLNQGLFKSSFLVFFENILETQLKDEILKNLNNLRNSQNFFVFLEFDISKEILEKFKKITSNIFDCSLKKTSEKSEVFNIAYLFEKRDKKETWIQLIKLLENNVNPENISGILFWKIKDLIIHNNFKNYSLEELKKMASVINSLFHDAHLGRIDFKAGLEKFILENL